MSNIELPSEFVPLLTSSPKKENGVVREWIPLMASTPKEGVTDSSMESTAAFQRDTVAVVGELNKQFSNLKVKFSNTV